MASQALSIVPIPLARRGEVVDVFADAFAGYPVMRFTVGDAGDVAARERRLVRLFVERRTRRGGPMYGIEIGKGGGNDRVRDQREHGELDGAILLTLPVEPPPPDDVAEISAEAWRELGDDARLRYDDYAAAGARVLEGLPPHLHLNMIGVRRAHKGAGLGRVLLDAVRQIAEAEPAAAGISLTTENPRNVDLYQHFGYKVVGNAPFAPGLETWGMYLEIR